MSQKAHRPGKTGKFVLGAERYERISAVEGIALTPAMKERLTQAQQRKVSPEEYRQSIIDAHRKS